MAKFEEKDSRWIVEDKGQDGRNVNNWHWTERDCLPWAKQRLQELLGGQTLTDGSGGVSLSTGPGVEVSGDAIVNNRKNKVIPSYELEIRGAWKGEVSEGPAAGVAEGRFTLPYLADENADEDPELKVSSSSEGKTYQQLKEAFLSQGKQVIHAAVRKFVAEMKAGGPSGSGSSSSGASNGAAEGSKEAAAEAAEVKARAEESRRALEAKKAAEARARAAEDRAKTGTVQLRETFYARPADLFDCFTNPARVQAFTQSPARVEPRPGGAFSIYGGSAEATFTELEAPTKLALDWRFKSWPDGATSKVVITLEEPDEGTTTLRLVQKGVPKEDRFGNGDVVESTAQGWQRQIFQRIRGVFGYGVGL